MTMSFQLSGKMFFMLKITELHSDKLCVCVRGGGGGGGGRHVCVCVSVGLGGRLFGLCLEFEFQLSCAHCKLPITSISITRTKFTSFKLCV